MKLEKAVEILKSLGYERGCKIIGSSNRYGDSESLDTILKEQDEEYYAEYWNIRLDHEYDWELYLDDDLIFVS